MGKPSNEQAQNLSQRVLVALRMPRWLKQLVAEAAAAEGASMSEFIRQVLIDRLGR